MKKCWTAGVISALLPTSKTPWASQKTVRSTLLAEGVFFNFFRTGDDGCFHSIDAASVQRFSRTQSPDFFLEGFLKLIKRYEKCINLLGTYVEK